MKTLITLVLLMAGVVTIGGSASAAEPCNPAGKLDFVCGPLNSEDLVQVPGTGWIVASGMDGGAAGSHGSLHLVNSRDKSWKALFPVGNPQLRWDKATYGDCPGEPELSKFSAHGLNLRHGKDGVDTLYVVNHGGREAIEIFDLDTKGAEPIITWVGCAVMPSHTWPNSVAPLPDGGMVVTDMFDPGDQKAQDKLATGENTGAVYEWHPHKGFAMVPGSQFSGDNGIEVSRDGKWIYVAAWGNKSVVRLARNGGGSTKPETLSVGFLADNLRWAPDGKLVLAGQDTAAKQVFSCFESHETRCTQPWRIVKWDTAAMKIDPLISEKGNPEFGDATVGLQVGDDMFVGTFRGERIAYFSLE
ncbi:MAG TPA: SMP-30/gluconolactonase/LRE family protein [Stellaceae bacterium]|nr:SMP-30/gluconolactonase/LRE family protein [Stellaceae bacterium]